MRSGVSSTGSGSAFSLRSALVGRADDGGAEGCGCGACEADPPPDVDGVPRLGGNALPRAAGAADAAAAAAAPASGCLRALPGCGAGATGAPALPGKIPRPPRISRTAEAIEANESELEDEAEVASRSPAACGPLRQGEGGEG